MAQAALKKPPKPPTGFNKEMADLWKDSCNRFIGATGCIYKSDLAYVEMYVRSYMRWKWLADQAATAGLYDEKLKINDLFRFECEMASKTRQNYRAMENTILERVRLGQVGESQIGGRTGVRQTPSRDGVPSVGAAKKSDASGISWLDDARKKAKSA